ncbi:hypothetical protein [Nocardia sp. NPDC051463]|uniref:hypothetical protein n=1 Tax=Nocardia sp. NPDC051463 TaxID=3154845 RepID=UPI00344D1BD6
MVGSFVEVVEVVEVLGDAGDRGVEFVGVVEVVGPAFDVVTGSEDAVAVGAVWTGIPRYWAAAPSEPPKPS